MLAGFRNQASTYYDKLSPKAQSIKEKERQELLVQNEQGAEFTASHVVKGSDNKMYATSKLDAPLDPLYDALPDRDVDLENQYLSAISGQRTPVPSLSGSGRDIGAVGRRQLMGKPDWGQTVTTRFSPSKTELGIRAAAMRSSRSTRRKEESDTSRPWFLSNYHPKDVPVDLVLEGSVSPTQKEQAIIHDEEEIEEDAEEQTLLEKIKAGIDPNIDKEGFLANYLERYRTVLKEEADALQRLREEQADLRAAEIAAVENSENQHRFAGGAVKKKAVKQVSIEEKFKNTDFFVEEVPPLLEGRKMALEKKQKEDEKKQELDNKKYANFELLRRRAARRRARLQRDELLSKSCDGVLDELAKQEKFLLEEKRLAELEKVRPPVPYWYALKNREFQGELNRANKLLRSPPAAARAKEIYETTLDSMY